MVGRYGRAHAAEKARRLRAAAPEAPGPPWGPPPGRGGPAEVDRGPRAGGGPREYSGLEHARACNRSAGGRAGAAARAGRSAPRVELVPVVSTGDEDGTARESSSPPPLPVLAGPGRDRAVGPVPAAASESAR